MAAALNTLELLAAEKADHGGRERRGDPQRRGPAGGRDPQRRRQRHGAVHRPRAGGGRAAAAHPPQRPRHQAGDPESGPEDGARPGPSAGDAATSGRRCAGGGCWWSTPTRTSAAPPTPCWNVTAAWSRRPTTAPRRCSWSAPDGRARYDVIIADIRLPDMNGYEFMLKLQEMMDPVPLILMTGFGYDPGHSIVKARQGRAAAGRALQAVPPRPVAQRRGAHHRGPQPGAPGVGKLTAAAMDAALLSLALLGHAALSVARSTASMRRAGPGRSSARRPVSCC